MKMSDEELRMWAIEQAVHSGAVGVGVVSMAREIERHVRPEKCPHCGKS